MCARMASSDSALSEDAAAALAEARQPHERAELCHEMRGLLCPLGEAASVCDAGSDSLRYRVLKRTIDVLGGLIGSAITVVLLPAIAAIVKIQSPGPIFFTQDRVGLDGLPFQLLKFRTMHEKTSDEARWASEEEDRIFGFGAFMRRFHIDEFPQFFNVLRGNMSLVGPRPEQVPNVERLSVKIPNYDKRHCALPGLTGWSQLRHGYAGCELTSWIKTASDLYYVKHRGLRLDLSILLNTLPTVLTDEQADNDRLQAMVAGLEARSEEAQATAEHSRL